MARGALLHLLQRAARAASVTASPPRVSDASSRRMFLQRGSALAAAGALPSWTAAAAGPGTRSRVLIVGAGLAGLTAAYTLRQAGIHATVYEGSPRVGGRCWTETSAFAHGQIAERGGELIDSPHTEIRTLAAHFGLPLDDLIDAEPPGSQPIAFFDDRPYTLEDINRDFVAVRPRLEADAAALGEDLPTWRRSTAAQRALDRMSATQWIATRVPGGGASRFGRLLANAYTEELGGDPDEISAITVVSLLAASPRDRFSPYEESDQRFHIRGGNDQLADRLAQSVGGQIEPHSRLVGLAQSDDGRCRVTVLRDGAERVEVADRVIVAIPFALLRVVDLRGAGFRARKQRSIHELGMGRNTKVQLQFDDRWWLRANGNGEIRLAGAFQTTWEVTRAQPGTAGILNCFSGGALAETAGHGDIDARALDALRDIERVQPGAANAWNRRVIRNAWDRNPWSLGSYALVKPGQYTAFYGVEGEREGNVFFAGEHTSADWQGYLNGAVETGQRAAGEVLESIGMRRVATLLHERSAARARVS
jgi:monoamine oxidase